MLRGGGGLLAHVGRNIGAGCVGCGWRAEAEGTVLTEGVTFLLWICVHVMKCLFMHEEGSSQHV